MTFKMGDHIKELSPKVGKPPRVGVIKEINPPDMLTGCILNSYVIVLWENVETIMSTVKKNSIRLVPQASTTAALRSPTSH